MRVLQNVAFVLVRFGEDEPRWHHASLLDDERSGLQVLEERHMPYAVRVKRDWRGELLTRAKCDEIFGVGNWLVARDEDEFDDGEPVLWLACSDDAKFVTARLYGLRIPED